MSVTDIKNAFARVTRDNTLDVKDVEEVLKSAGNISRSEEKALREEASRYAGITDPAAAQKLRESLGEISQLRQRAEDLNRRVQIDKKPLDADIKQRLASADGKTFGGTKIPDAVKKLVNDGIKNGVTAYDVREMDTDPVYDTSHGDAHLTLDGKFNPYAQEQPAVDSMAFAHTELTPQKIKADLRPQTWRELDGYTDSPFGNSKVARFKTVTGTPTARITELYDEASWGETMARGPGGQKYASNFAILADGSFHAVPASRRSEGDPRRILTTASLARGKQMLFNGHLHLNDAGMVTYVGLSGRLSKLQEKGDAKFIDPIALLKAWGFQLAPGLTVTREG